MTRRRARRRNKRLAPSELTIPAGQAPGGYRLVVGIEGMQQSVAPAEAFFTVVE